MLITGTVNKRLIAYIERVQAYLGLEGCDIELGITRTCDGGAGGYCHGDDEEVIIEIARIDDLGPLSAIQLKKNIAHEMVHAFQLLTKQMVNVGMVACSDSPIGLKYVVEWEGKPYSNVPYNDQPWEIDAYGKEAGVYEMCK